MRTLSRRRSATIAAFVGVALAIGSGAVAANAATVAPATTSSSTGCSFGQHLRSALGETPSALKTDRAAVKAMAHGAARRTAAQAIATKALAGGYGQGVEVRAEWLKANKGQHLRPLPAALKADLKTLKGETKTQRAATLEGISGKALAGTYGTTLESFAKTVKSSTVWTDCTPAK
jgi:hypothetical protein